MIWRWSEEERKWSLFTTAAANKPKKKKKKTLWVALKSRHYTWLKPVSVEDGDKQRLDMQTAALAAPRGRQGFSGAGKAFPFPSKS
eukprot:2675838-Pyramimonas_sp.AAC.1